jgi:hypothetical protein
VCYVCVLTECRACHAALMAPEVTRVSTLIGAGHDGPQSGSADGPGLRGALFDTPTAVAVDPRSGDILICDQVSHALTRSAARTTCAASTEVFTRLCVFAGQSSHSVVVPRHSQRRDSCRVIAGLCGRHGSRRQIRHAVRHRIQSSIRRHRRRRLYADTGAAHAHGLALGGLSLTDDRAVVRVVRVRVRVRVQPVTTAYD